MSMGSPSKNPWLRWALLAVFVVALSFTFVNLGRWQLDRLDQRRHGNEVVATNEGAPVVGFQQVMNRPITDADQWQRVSATGIFDPAHQLVVRYRSNAGKTGWEVVTPLHTTTGQVVLVDRGFVERRAGTDFPSAAPAPPPGEVTVVGHVRRDEVGKDNATTPEQNSIRLINSEAIGLWLERPVVNGYIGLLEVRPGQEGGFVPVATPSLDEGPHFSYAMQWFAFTFIAGLGLVVLIRNDIRDRRKAERGSDGSGAQGQGLRRDGGVRRAGAGDR